MKGSAMRKTWLCLAAWLCILTVAAGGAEAAESGAPASPESAAPAAEPVTAETETETPARAAPKSPGDLLVQAYETFNRGGAIMWVLLAASAVGLTFVLERAASLRASRHLPEGLVGLVERKLSEGGVDVARLELKGRGEALARVLDGLLARRDATREEMERVLEDEAGRVLWDLRKNVRPVGIIASLAPLLGLLGTVFGLIQAFEKAAELGMDDPKNFAEGIYVALYTTAFGLTVAIPMLLAYHFLRGQADVIMRQVEDLGIKFIIDSDAARRGRTGGSTS